MNKTTAAILASLAVFVGIPNASAGVTVLATLSPDSIQVGGVVELELKLTLAPDPFDFGATFKGGNVTLFSGDGQSKTFSIPPPGGTTRDFMWDVTYLTAGNYIPSYKGEVTYRESFHETVCHRHECETETEHREVELKLKGLFSDPTVLGGDQVNVATAAPELSTWAMMLIGFAGVGWVAYRRSRKLTTVLSAS